MAGILSMAFCVGAGNQTQVPVHVQKEAVSSVSDCGLDLFNYVCLNGFCLQVCMCAWSEEGMGSPELELRQLQSIMWVLRTQPCTSMIVASGLNC